ncbi:MAG: tRNA (adenosine(37)-N6)-threonylcarbamoyltransferase complex dimerization subunit type 1 TsaB [Planctomycetota bacterium]
MLLAIELSGPRNTLAVGDAERVVSIDFSDQRGRGLMTALGQLLQDASLEKHDLRGILVGVGPGSYTGLRIACSAGIMLGHGLAIPCGGLHSFDAAAFAATEEGQTVHLVLDAYRQEVYHACYRRGAQHLETLTPAQVLPVAEVATAVGQGLVLGDPKFTPDGQHLKEDCQPSAVDLLHFAFTLGVQSDGTGIDALLAAEPLYLRPAAFRRPS